VFSGGEPYGLCTYRSPRSGRCYFFVTGKSGAVEQFVLEDAGGGKIGGARVRGFKLGSAAEGCVADHELGNLYVAEENVGIWKFDAEPETRRAGTLVAKVGDHGLRSDVEGLDIYYASGGRGYLIATSQGNDSFKVYAREGINRFLLTIDPRADVIDDAEDTDGIAVTNRPTSWRFPKGLLVVQDGHDEGGTQNFHLYPWEEIAGTRLLVDTARSPRGAAAK
jgi:3-phytase